MIISGFGSGKTNALLNLISQQDDIDKIYLQAKDLGESKYQFLIGKLENTRIKHLNGPKAFVECSNTMDDAYENIEDYNSTRKRKMSIDFYNIIADIMSNKKCQAIVKELSIRCRKLNIPLVFITQPYFSVPRDVKLNSTHYLLMKINIKKELQNIAITHSVDNRLQRCYEDLQRVYKRDILFFDN